MTTETLTRLPEKTYADFSALDEGTLAQLIDGEIIMSPAPNVLHQRIVTRLSAALNRFVETHELGLVLVSPVDVRFSESEAYQPDVVFVARDRLHLLTEQEVDGAPDLVVEVLSPSTGYYDLTKKRRVYEQSGVKEYWIVDPGERTVEVLANGDEGFRTAVRRVEQGTVDSQLLEGFVVDVAPLFTIGKQ